MKNYFSKSIIFLIILYIALITSIITWGIPNAYHPFNYQMDEWHQMQAVRNLFKYGSPNIPGSAHGTILHFFLSGLYIAPFFLIRIVNPFEVKSSLDHLLTQERLFIILRTNTLLFGVLSIILISLISKRYFKTNPLYAAFLFVFTPLWLVLSNYFKYDIALNFWLLLALCFIFEFGKSGSKKIFLFAGLLCGIAIAIKISALPLVPIYVASFFIYKSSKLNFKYLIYGLIICFLSALLLGIPDILLGKGDIREFIYSNLSSSPGQTWNFILPLPWYIYLPFRVFPLDFGYIFSIISFSSILYYIKTKDRNIKIILIGLFFFIVSLIPLKIYAGGNRFLVLLPFLALLSGAFIQKIVVKNRALYLVFILFLSQSYQSIQSLSYKWNIDPRVVSSKWIELNIPKGSEIGLENIPIYQSIPDLILKDFYSKEDFKNYRPLYRYKIVDNSSSLPNYVIITNKNFDSQYMQKSEKKDLIKRLNKDNYGTLKKFNVYEGVYRFSGNNLDLYLSGLVQTASIDVFGKK